MGSVTLAKCFLSLFLFYFHFSFIIVIVVAVALMRDLQKSHRNSLGERIQSAQLFSVF